MNAKKFKKTATFTLVMLVSLLLSLPAFSASRIKDIADFEGVRDNQLVGYGMVVGLTAPETTSNQSILPRKAWFRFWTASVSTRATVS